jgi:hypothetical protein
MPVPETPDLASIGRTTHVRARSDEELHLHLLEIARTEMKFRA